MTKIKIIEKAKTMRGEGALRLLEYHKQLRDVRIARLKRELKETSDEREEIEEGIIALKEALSKKPAEVGVESRDEPVQKLEEEEKK